MGTAQVPVEVVSESPEHGELSALTVRIAGIFGRIDTSGALEQRLERAAIPLRAGRVHRHQRAAIALMLGGRRRAIVTGSPIRLHRARSSLVAAIAWYLPSRRAAKRIKQMQEQLPDALALMAASVEGGQTFQRSIDMYRRDARPPLSDELDRVMAEVAVGSDLVVALENMAERSGVEDLKWAVEAVRIQQSTGGRLAPDPPHAGRLHADPAGGAPRGPDARRPRAACPGYVLFAIPIFLVRRAGGEGSRLPAADVARRRARSSSSGRRGSWPWASGSSAAWSTSRSEGRRSRERGIHRPAGGHHADGRSASSASVLAAVALAPRRPSGSTSSGRSGSEAEIVRRGRARRPTGCQTPLVSRIFGPAAQRSAPQPVAALPLERHRPGARRPAQGRPDRLGAGRGVRRHPGRDRCMLGFGVGLVSLVSGVVSVKIGLGPPVHPAHARRPGAQLVAAPPHQDAAASR